MANSARGVGEREAKDKYFIFSCGRVKRDFRQETRAREIKIIIIIIIMCGGRWRTLYLEPAHRRVRCVYHENSVN